MYAITLVVEKFNKFTAKTYLAVEFWRLCPFSDHNINYVKICKRYLA